MDLKSNSKPSSTVHILNGNALLEQFPSTLAGAKLVFRECLVDGPVKADSLESFYEQRAHFLSAEYKACTKAEYFSVCVKEFEAIQQIPANSAINLWFEDDLFCQVNLWFTLQLLKDKSDCSLCIVRPDSHSPYGFAAYTEEELLTLYKNRRPIEKLPLLLALWPAYSQGNLVALQKSASTLPATYSFIKKAVTAHSLRITSEDKLGLPLETLQEIIEDVGTNRFGLIYQEFQKRLPIYGYGDLQVARLVKLLSPTK